MINYYLGNTKSVFGCFVLFCFEIGSLHNPGRPGTQSVDTDLEFKRENSTCLCLPSGGTKGLHHHTRFKSVFVSEFVD